MILISDQKTLQHVIKEQGECKNTDATNRNSQIRIKQDFKTKKRTEM